jgi:hypothetical protein
MNLLLHIFSLAGLRHALTFLACCFGMAFRLPEPERYGWGHGSRKTQPTKPVDPLEQMRKPREFTMEEKSKFFGSKSDAKAAADLKRLSPDVYRRMRAESELDGLVAAPSYFDPQRDKLPDGRRTFSPEELALRAQYSESELRTFFKETTGSKVNPGTLAKNDPAKYAEMVKAAVSFGILPPESIRQIQQPARPRNEDNTFVLTDDLCAKFKLPSGTKVSSAEFESMTRILIEQTAAAQTADGQGNKS